MAVNKWPEKISGRHLAGRLGDVAAMHAQAHAAATATVKKTVAARRPPHHHKQETDVYADPDDIETPPAE